MDFEEQLEKAERLPTPSLVGSSLRSADDSQHKNYIHPEKYAQLKREKKKKKKALLNSLLGASLDDLMSEGALLGSDEDFAQFLDADGQVKKEAKAAPANNGGHHPLSQATIVAPAASVSEPAGEPAAKLHAAQQPETESAAESEEEIDATPKPKPKRKGPVAAVHAAEGVSGGTGALYQSSDYSTPNLSEYQLDNQITDHDALLTSVQSHDPHRLPKLELELPASKAEPAAAPSLIVDGGDSAADHTGAPAGDFHLPAFLDRASRSRLRQLRGDARSGSRSRSRPHLARGDLYKNTHDEDPARYELPARFQAAAVPEDVGEEEDRQSRQSRPTMGDSIAALEAEAAAKAAKAAQLRGANAVDSAEAVADSDDVALLVTTGDYTNFDVDRPGRQPLEDADFTKRSASSTNYLRSISRSRSRQPTDRSANPLGTLPAAMARSHSLLNEKNDADPAELEKEGALISDDPYLTIDGLDTMVEEVLNPKESDEEGRTTEVAKAGEAKEGAAGTRAGEAVAGESESVANATEGTEPSEDQIERAETKGLVTELDTKTTEPEPEAEAPVAAAKEESDLEKDEAKAVDLEKTEPSAAAVDAEARAKVGRTGEEGEKAREANASTERSAADSEPTVTDLAPEDASEPADEKAEPTTANSEPKPAAERSAADAEPTVTDLAPAEASEPAKTEPAGAESASQSTDVPPSVAVLQETADSRPSTDLSPDASAQPSAPPKEALEHAHTTATEDDDFDVSPEELRQHLEAQPVYVFTSLAGGMHITTRTNRLATILSGNGIKFAYRDLGTDEAAKKLWRRYAIGKLLPGVVRGDDYIGNFQDIEEANEEYKVRELIYETL